MLVKTILDNAQSYLHDDGTIWSRQELLNWLNDAYIQMLARSQALVRPFQIDIPGRHTWAITHEWEDRYGSGTMRKFSLSVLSATLQTSSRWEAETIEGITSTASDEGQTQLWERAYSNQSENRFMFAMSRAHERPRQAYWDDKHLIGASVRELDMLETEWWQQGGEPMFFFPSNAGREGTYEVYQIVTTYNQSYDLQDMENGIPRRLSGSRTYSVSSQTDRWSMAYTNGGDTVSIDAGPALRITGQASDTDQTYFLWSWEEDHLEGGTAFANGTAIGTDPFNSEVGLGAATEVTLGVGVARYISSPDRQYVPAPYDGGTLEICGIPRDYKSSEDSLTIWEIIVPTRTLTEQDEIGFLPDQMGKYLRFYILSRSFGHKGQGMNQELSQIYLRLYQIGLEVMTRIANQSFIDRNYARQEFAGSPIGRIPKVQLPSTFERVF